MDRYPNSCRKCPVKKRCGYKYREHNRTPRGIGCLFNEKKKYNMNEKDYGVYVMTQEKMGEKQYVYNR